MSHVRPVARPLDAQALEIQTDGHPVLEVIRARKVAGTLPGQHGDGHVVALSIEGGGMRAAVSGGMVVALEQLGLSNVFDRIYGASGGLFNAAYFMAKQANYGSTIYSDNLTNKRFIDFGRLPKSLRGGPPVVSVDYAIDEVMSNERAVDWDAVIHSPIELHPIAASLDEWRAVDLGRPQTVQQLQAQLRASSRVMVFGGPPYEIEGSRYYDASLFMGIPYDLLIEQGATHVLALLTRPGGQVRRGQTLFERTLVARVLKRIDPRLPQAMKDRIETYRSTVTRLEEATRAPGAEAPFAYAVQPTGGELSQLARDPRTVQEAAIAGMRAAYQLAGASPQFVPVLLPYA
jgi:predicted patatin/cPLA2 family phospholipase